jgi:histone H3/H4
MVIGSSDEEEQDAAELAGSGTKKRKVKEKADLSHLRGPVDLARATVSNTMRAAAGDAPVSRDASVVASECARLFVHYLAARTSEIAKERNKTIVLPQLVMEAVKDLEFEFMLPTLEALIEQDSNKKENKKQEKQEEEKILLRARLQLLQDGAAVVEEVAVAPQQKQRGKPPKRKIETLTIAEITALLQEK